MSQFQLSLKEQSYVNIAIDEAKKSQVLMRIGCVAVMNGKIISKGQFFQRMLHMLTSSYL